MIRLNVHEASAELDLVLGRRGKGNAGLARLDAELEAFANVLLREHDNKCLYWVLPEVRRIQRMVRNALESRAFAAKTIVEGGPVGEATAAPEAARVA